VQGRPRSPGRTAPGTPMGTPSIPCAPEIRGRALFVLPPGPLIPFLSLEYRGNLRAVHQAVGKVLSGDVVEQGHIALAQALNVAVVRPTRLDVEDVPGHQVGEGQHGRPVASAD